MLVGLVGAVACYAWLFIMLGTSAFLPGAGGLDVASGAGHLACIVGVVAALFVSWAFSNALSAHRLVQFCLAAALAASRLRGAVARRRRLPRGVGSPALALGLGFRLPVPALWRARLPVFLRERASLRARRVPVRRLRLLRPFVRWYGDGFFLRRRLPPRGVLPPICSSWWCTGSTRARWWTAGNRTGVRAWCGAPTWRRSRRAWPPGSRARLPRFRGEHPVGGLCAGGGAGFRHVPFPARGFAQMAQG